MKITVHGQYLRQQVNRVLLLAERQLGRTMATHQRIGEEAKKPRRDVTVQGPFGTAVPVQLGAVDIPPELRQGEIEGIEHRIESLRWLEGALVDNENYELDLADLRALGILGGGPLDDVPMIAGFR